MIALDHETCYDVIRRRDARFDGRFYTAVTSTGIFCRPSCPARTPKKANVRFYTHAATASEAGFRPCRRCRPELAPGHPEWNRRADLAGRALRAIESGAVDRLGVRGLAADLGVSERHLRRELQREVGTGPLQLARARRLWLARLLLDQTTLTVTEVAFAAGFGSLRQFNDSVRAAFHASPSELRRHRAAPASGGDASPGGTVSLELPCRGRLGWEALHRFFAARAIPGLEEVTDDGFRRHLGPTAAVTPGPATPAAVGAITPADGDSGWLELRAPDDDALTLSVSLPDLSILADLLPVVRRVADLDTDLEPIEAHLRTDPELARRLDLVPLGRLPGPFDPFEVAVRAVVGQQVSVAGARTLLGRLLTLVSNTSAETGPTGFPTPDAVAATDLSGLGMPQRRRDTITAVARAVADGAVDLGPLSDGEQVRTRLLDVPGIGPWTAGYVAMRALGDPDGWPEADLVLCKSLGVTGQELARRAEAWRPWRAYAALALWQTADQAPTSPTAADATTPTLPTPPTTESDAA
ncbi:MAG: Ada metal-binding domain-containing protein [Actinomycetota bacterium]